MSQREDEHGVTDVAQNMEITGAPGKTSGPLASWRIDEGGALCSVVYIMNPRCLGASPFVGRTLDRMEADPDPLESDRNSAHRGDRDVPRVTRKPGVAPGQQVRIRSCRSASLGGVSPSKRLSLRAPAFVLALCHLLDQLRWQRGYLTGRSSKRSELVTPFAQHLDEPEYLLPIRSLHLIGQSIIGNAIGPPNLPNRLEVGGVHRRCSLLEMFPQKRACLLELLLNCST